MMTTGDGNVAVGTDCLKSGTTVDYNIAIGNAALYKLVDANGVAEAGDHNIGIGRYALRFRCICKWFGQI